MADESFDIVVSMNGFHAFPDKQKAFGETWRVLKPGGTFLICNECSGDTDKGDKWTRKIEGMTIAEHIHSTRSLSKVLSVDRGSRSFLIQKPGCHVPQGLLHGAWLICKAFRCCGMAEAAV